MAMQLLPSSNNTYENQSEEQFDKYCTNLFVGPLIWGIFSVPCACVGVPATIWLLWVLIQRQRRGLSNDIYMLNLTVMDLMFNLGILPTTVNYLFVRNDFLYWFRYFIYCINNTGRPLLLAFICVDCYIAVVYPIVYRKLKSTKHRIVATALAWGLTLLYGIAFALDVSDFIFITTCLVISFVLPLPTMIFCDLSILYTLRKPDPSGRTGVHPQKQRALQTITNNFIVILTIYPPPIIMYSVFNLISLPTQVRVCSFLIPTLISPMLGSSIMPLLHLGNLGSFKNLKGFQCCKF